jgi:hypothetical protein
MTVAAQMLDTYPADLGEVDKGKLAACIDACVECAQACTACADACLSEDMVAELIRCIRTCANCADVCDATRPGAVPAHRLRREPHPRGARGLHCGVHGVRGRVRAARVHARALPGLRGVLPPL